MTARVPYDELGLFHENAGEFGLPYDRPPTVRRVSVEVGGGGPSRRLSALRWGTGAPEVVLLHGGAQNAHTWDTVAMALGRPLVALDLPGHGHSDGPADETGGATSPQGIAADIAAALPTLAPEAGAVVGMSLGGLTAIALAGLAPELVRSLVLVDVTPGVNAQKAHAITAFVNGPKTFPSFDELLTRTIEHNPTRTVSSLRRGILHNAVQQDDGTWMWRYRRFGDRSLGAAPTTQEPDGPFARFQPLWETLGAVSVPVMLVRGMLPQSVVDDDDEAELARRLPGARIEHIANAGHSVQGDTPIELAELLQDFVPQGSP